MSCQFIYKGRCGYQLGNDVPWPDPESMIAAGSWDENFEKMKAYWDNRLAGLVQIEKLPDQRLADAFRAGSILASRQITVDREGA